MMAPGAPRASRPALLARRPQRELGEHLHFHLPPLQPPSPGTASKEQWMVLSSVQPLSLIQLFSTPWTAAHQASLSITNSRSLLRLLSIKSVMPSDHLILCCPLLLLPSIFPSIIESFPMSQFFTSSGQSIGVSASASVLPMNTQDPGLISFRIDWLDLLAVQETLKSLLQHHSSKASILLCSAFFIVQLSHPFMTTGKTIALLEGPLWTK